MDTVKTSEEINHDRRRLLAGATKGIAVAAMPLWVRAKLEGRR
jgi:hypothetical protein